jgi:hypothetical protein
MSLIFEGLYLGTQLTLIYFQGIHQLRGRRMGSTVHVDVHIEVCHFLEVDYVLVSSTEVLNSTLFMSS